MKFKFTAEEFDQVILFSIAVLFGSALLGCAALIIVSVFKKLLAAECP